MQTINRYFILIMAVLTAACGAHAWQPVGSLQELYDDTLLPRLRPGVKAASFSSYDRTGGNNDGFSGTYSKLREEDGNSVIAEMAGPGCIYRFWTTHSIGETPGLLERKGEHIRIYLDGSDTPSLDVPLESLFDNSLGRFPHPLAGQGIGGFYSYIPIPYEKSCKVVLEGPGVRFYQLNYVTFPSAVGVKSFQMELTGEERDMLQKAVVRWSDPLGDLKRIGNATEVPVIHLPAGKDYTLFSHTLKTDEPMMVYGLTLEDIDPAALRRSEIEITCSDTPAASVRLPLTFFFGQAFNAKPFASLLFGRLENLCYNRVPFVYTGECTVRLHGILPVEGKMKIFQAPLSGPVEEYGVLGAQYHESLPTIPAVLHPLLQATGKGHVVGTYMVTEGPHGLPFWLEGDDRWTIDDALRIHGTGSEDYFNCGWYALEGRLNGPAALPSHGFPVYGVTKNTMRAAAFRWHYSDCVPFDTSIDFGIEHGEVNRHIAEYRSVTFWYTAR